MALPSSNSAPISLTLLFALAIVPTQTQNSHETAPPRPQSSRLRFHLRAQLIQLWPQPLLTCGSLYDK
ncbi:hypothetical protein CRG98_042415 [Punica granatum]|uniref:Uncharacterized protein n=1 Tax=Punica granatum TaxID=22663 RepID=A0A2I0HZP9_PUNGR|nr:hypothetical protein CRG98_042415 [Punica granatum]